MYRTGTITNDSHGWPLDGGGGTVCPDSICALRTAQHSTAQITQSSSSKARRTVAFHVPCEARHFRNPSIRLVRERKTRTAAMQASACLLDPAQNQFPYASCADLPAPGGFFVLTFPDFELKST